jgi:serine/threonine protein kinase
MDFLKKLFERKPRVPKIDIGKRFELYGRVGQGSMSKVWKARDSKLGKTVALKILDIDKTNRLEARFKGLKKPTEGEIAVTLKHPHIVKTLEHGVTTKNEAYLVMEYVEGVALSFLISAQNEVMKQNCLRMTIELGEAINYFHRQNWIHRDICPRNVLLDENNKIKLIDFGLVVPNTPQFQAPGNRTGTANYMAPELIRRQKTDQRIDIFSYSVTCFEMFAGQLPWESGQTLEAILSHINSPPADLKSFCPDLDQRVVDTIMKGLAIYPSDRWQRISEMIEVLRTVHSEQNARQ